MKVTTNRKVTKQDRKPRPGSIWPASFRPFANHCTLARPVTTVSTKDPPKQEPRRLEGHEKEPKERSKKVVAFNSFIVKAFDRSIYTVSEVSCSHKTKNIKVGQQSCYRHSDCSNSNLWINPFCYWEKAVARTAPEVASIREAPPKVPTPSTVNWREAPINRPVFKSPWQVL